MIIQLKQLRSSNTTGSRSGSHETNFTEASIRLKASSVAFTRAWQSTVAPTQAFLGHV
jgi:hypothetical protein